VKAKALIIIPMVQTMSQSLMYFCTKFGFSSIRPVIIKVVSEMKRKAKGRATVPFVRGTSVIMRIAAKPPKIKNDRIINEFMICLIRITSISDSS
jgi:hypothetical protein